MNRQHSTWPGTGRDDHQAGPRAVGRRGCGQMPGQLLWLVLLMAVLGQASADPLRFSLIETARSTGTGEFRLNRSGWAEPETVSHVVVLIEHADARLLFGTGLGRQVDAQMAAELPWRPRRYAKVWPVRDQLERAGIAVDRILLSSPRWDQASGLADFPELPVLASRASLDYLGRATPPAVLPSQFRHAVNWTVLAFDDGPFDGYAMSTDLFGDGSVVLVPLAEHGALGLFLTVADGRRFFFSGDTLGRVTPADEAGGRSGLRLQAAAGLYPRWVE